MSTSHERPVPHRGRHGVPAAGQCGQAIYRILDAPATPAYLRNRRFNILAANQQCFALYQGVIAPQTLPLNLAYGVFAGQPMIAACPRGDLNTQTREISPDRGNHATTIPATMMLMLKLSPVFLAASGLPGRSALRPGRRIPVRCLRCWRERPG